MNKQEQNNIEEINANVISLDAAKGINYLRMLCRKKPKNKIHINDIRCQYKGFTFTINIDDVNIPLKSGGENDTKIIISKPKNLEFNRQSCHTKDDIKMTIINNGEELQFENFSFEKLPFDDGKKEEINTSEKTIFDNIVETGITTAFGYNEFDIEKKENVKYNFPLHYNAHGIFKIPVNENENDLPKTIKIQDMECKIDKQSAILFKENEDKTYKKPFEYIVIDADGETFFNVDRNNPVDEVKSGKFNNATQVKLQYDEMYDQINKETETQNNNNIFAKIFCCCYNKTSENKKAEINIPIVHPFRNIKGIVVE